MRLMATTMKTSVPKNNPLNSAPHVAARDWSSEPCVRLIPNTAPLAIIVGYNRVYGPLVLRSETTSRVPYFPVNYSDSQMKRYFLTTNRMRLLQNPRFHLGLFTFNPYGVDIVKRITPLASCFHPR